MKIDISAIKQETENKLQSVSKNGSESHAKKIGQTLFLVQSANECICEARLQPHPKDLYYNLWFEGEVCILFADTNLGKSILGIQIGCKIAEQQPVAYFDFELSGKQFEARYSNNYTNHYTFPDNLKRIAINPDDPNTEYDSFEDYLLSCLEAVITETGIKILIIDNITYLKSETEKSKFALPLMKKLKKLKNQHSLSILALAHTPKRDLSKPITQNDLGGSKMIMNFCDSAFAIGASQKDPAIRYIKQIKTRYTELKHGAENVLIYEISKPDNFLFMAFTGYGCEREHLQQRTEKDWEKIKEQVKELVSKGKGQREIARELSISASVVNKYIKETS